MGWHNVIAASSMPNNTMRNFEVSGQKFLLVNAGGNFYAVSHWCSHDDVELALGCIKGDTIHCSLHGGSFDLKTGRVLSEPADVPLQTWRVQINSAQVQVFL